jgi:hypothetical protein
MSQFLVGLLVGSAILASVPEVSAQEFSGGTRSVGLGNAYTAVATGVDGIYHNPAGIAHAIMYNIGGRYAYNPRGNVLNASIVDSKTNPSLSAGVSYSYFSSHEDENKTISHDLRAALAIPALPEQVSLGVGGRLLISETDGVENVNGITLDAGVLFEATEQLRFGFAGQNLIDVCKKDNECGGVAPRTIHGGFSFGDSQIFLLSGDISADLTSRDELQIGADVGTEYQIAGAFPVRLGYSYRQLESANYVSGGLGWRSSQAGVDAAYRQNISRMDNFEVTTTISLYF